MKSCIYSFYKPNFINKYPYHLIHQNNVKRYCKTHGIAYEFLQSSMPKYQLNLPQSLRYYGGIYYRFYISQLLQKYERVLYVDSDILFLKGCQNIFELVPDENIGYTINQSSYQHKLIHDFRMQFYNKIYNTQFSPTFAGMGVNLFPKWCKEDLSIELLQLKRYYDVIPNSVPDCIYMSYLVSKYKSLMPNKVTELPIQYNFLYPHKLYENTQQNQIKRAFAQSGQVKIIHFAGLPTENLAPIRYQHMLYFDKKFGVV